MDYNRDARYAMTAQPSTPQQESQQEIFLLIQVEWEQLGSGREPLGANQGLILIG